MRKLGAAAALALVLATAACGGGDGRPSKGDIADFLKDGASSFGELPDGAVDCVAEAISESDLSDEALQAIVDGDTDVEPTGDDAEALAGVMGSAVTCMTGTG